MLRVGFSKQRQALEGERLPEVPQTSSEVLGVAPPAQAGLLLFVQETAEQPMVPEEAF